MALLPTARCRAAAWRGRGDVLRPPSPSCAMIVFSVLKNGKRDRNKLYDSRAQGPTLSARHHSA